MPRADPVMRSRQPRFQIGEDEMADREELFSSQEAGSASRLSAIMKARRSASLKWSRAIVGIPDRPEAPGSERAPPVARNDAASLV